MRNAKKLLSYQLKNLKPYSALCQEPCQNERQTRQLSHQEDPQHTGKEGLQMCA